MALSDEEQQMLNLIAERMYQEDPKLATSLASSNRSDLNKRRAALGVLLLLAGLAVLVASIPLQIIVVGPLGFLVALMGGVILYQALSADKPKY